MTIVFENPLLSGALIRRYKRFLADVELDTGETVTAHCANSGSLMDVRAPGTRVWLSPANNPKRKLRYTWELAEHEGSLVGINTSYPNRLVEAAIQAGRITELTGYDTIRREVKYGKNSRIDLLLQAEGKPDCYVEVKNCQLRRGDFSEFPDAVTARGAKHLQELIDMVKAGHRAVMLYCIQREDTQGFRLAADIDPAYAEAFAKARAAGVEAYAYVCKMSPTAISLDRPMKMAV